MLFFFPSCLGARKGAGMNTHPKALYDGLLEACSGMSLRLGSPLFSEVQDLFGTLVGAFRPPCLGQKARQALGAKCALGGIERLPTHAEGGSYLCDLASVPSPPGDGRSAIPEVYDGTCLVPHRGRARQLLAGERFTNGAATLKLPWGSDPSSHWKLHANLTDAAIPRKPCRRS